MTVSRVTNGEDNVREATRDLVLRAVRELNYSPNPAARSLAGATGTRIAMIYSNPSAAYLSELLVGALDKASRTAAQLVLEKWDELKPAAERAAARKLAQSVAGVILPPPLCESDVISSELAAAKIPVVAIATGRFRSERELRAHRRFPRRQRDDRAPHFARPHPHRLHQGPSEPDGERAALRGLRDHAGGGRASRSNPGLREQGYFTYRSGLDAAEQLLAASDRPPRSSPATTTWPPPSSPSPTGAVSRCRGTCRSWASTTRRLPPPSGPSSPPSASPSPPWRRRPSTCCCEGSATKKDGGAAEPIDHLFAHEMVNRGSAAAPPRE